MDKPVDKKSEFYKSAYSMRVADSFVNGQSSRNNSIRSTPHKKSVTPQFPPEDFELAGKWYASMKRSLKVCPTIDGLATFKNKKCDRYVSQKPEVAAYHTNLLTAPHSKIKNHTLYICPNFNEIELYVNFIIQNRLTSVLVAPLMANKSWYKILKFLAIGEFVLPTSSKKYVFVYQGKPTALLSHDCVAFHITKSSIDNLKAHPSMLKLIDELPPMNRVAKNLINMAQTVETKVGTSSSHCKIKDTPMLINKVSTDELQEILADFQTREFTKMVKELDDVLVDKMEKITKKDVELLEQENIFFCGVDDDNDRLELVFTIEEPTQTYTYMSELKQKINRVNCSHIRNQDESSYYSQKQNLWALEDLEDSIGDVKADDRDPTEGFTHSDPRIQELVKQYSAAFTPKNHDENDPKCGGFQHNMKLKEGVTPHHTKAYRMSPVEREALAGYLKKYLARNWIRRSRSNWASAVFLVPKKT